MSPVVILFTLHICLLYTMAVNQDTLFTDSVVAHNRTLYTLFSAMTELCNITIEPDHVRNSRAS